MAITAEELRILVRAETKSAVDNLNRFKKTSKSTTLDLKQLAKQLIGPLSVTAGLIALGRVASQAIRGSIAYAASVEQISIAFEVLTGSAEEAEAVLEDLRQFSVKTPFTFEELAPAAKRLIAFGTAAEDVVDVMRDLGNASAGNGETLNRLVDAYGKVQAKGRASLEELNRFTEAGVPLMRQLATDLGMTNEELFKFVSAGKVGFEEVNTALQNLTRGEGQFAGMLDAQSQTLEGTMSTLKGAVQELGRSFAEDLLPFLTEAVTAMTGIVNQVSKARSLDDVFSAVFGDDFGKAAGDTATEQLESVEQQIELATLAQEELQRILSGRKLFGGLEESKFTKRLGKGAIERMAFELENEIVRLSSQMPALTEAAAAEAAEMARASAEAAKKALEDPANQVIETISLIPTRTISAVRTTISALKPLEIAFTSITDPIEGERIVDVDALEEARLELERVAKAAETAAFEMELFGSEAQLVTENLNLSTFAKNFGELVIGGPEVDFDPIVKEANRAEKAIKDMWEALGGDFAQTLGNAGLTLLTDLGRSMTDNSKGAKSASEAMQDFISSIAASLPQLLFGAGIRALADPTVPWEVGAALLAASGLAALIGGAITGGMSTPESTIATPTETGVTSTTHGLGNAINPQVTNYNIAGNAFVDDQLGDRIQQEVGAMSSGR
jgi:tape measure domain-containing protein